MFAGRCNRIWARARLLGKLTSYNRATKDGRQSAIHRCVYTQKCPITLGEGQVKVQE